MKYYPVISTNFSPACNCANASSKVKLRILRNSAFEVFPQVSQIIFGGYPRRSTRSTKSLSLVIKITP